MSEVDPGCIASEECFNGYKVSDRDAFVLSVEYRLRDEEGDGTTLVHKMIDSAISSAIENGDDGFIDEETMTKQITLTR